MCADTRTYNSISAGWTCGLAGRGGFSKMESLLWMGATPKEASKNSPALWFEMKHSLLMAYSRHAFPFILGPQPACTVSSEQSQSPLFFFFFKGVGGLLQGTPFPVEGSAMAQRPGHGEIDIATWQWSIQSVKAPSSPAHRLSPPQHGLATLPESTNEGLVRARTTIPQRLWWRRI